MELDPGQLSVQQRYKLLSGAIVPRPIGLVSTLSLDGVPNLAPFSFFTGVGSNPMTLLFCPVNDPTGAEKDTLRNCKPPADGGRGEFVVNIVSEEFAARMAACAEPLPPEGDEFAVAGLTPSPSAVVSPPRVAESPIAFECRTLQVIRTNPGAVGGGNVVLGQVVHVAIREGVADARLRIDPAALSAVGRMGGQSYCFTSERFELPLGLAALETRPDGAAPSRRNRGR